MVVLVVALLVGGGDGRASRAMARAATWTHTGERPRAVVRDMAFPVREPGLSLFIAVCFGSCDFAARVRSSAAGDGASLMPEAELGGSGDSRHVLSPAERETDRTRTTRF